MALHTGTDVGAMDDRTGIVSTEHGLESLSAGILPELWSFCGNFRKNRPIALGF